MTLAGYRKDRPMVLGQHTPISLAREGGLWKRIPFLKDNEGMLPPYMIVVGDRRRVLAGAMPLTDHILLHKEVTKAGWGDEAVFKGRISHLIGELRAIQKLAQSKGLYPQPIEFEYLALKPSQPCDISSYCGTLRAIKSWYFNPPVSRRWFVEMDALISELEWLIGPKGDRALFEPNQLAGSLLMLSSIPPSNVGLSSQYYHAIVSLKLQYLADYVRTDAGRVNLTVGVFEYNGKPLPLTILETQMGCSAQDINAWEALVNSREDGYSLGGREVPAKGLIAIRAGTCGGIIIAGEDKKQLEEPFIEIGDVVNARYSFADGATVRQRMGAWNSMNRDDLKKFQVTWDNARTCTGTFQMSCDSTQQHQDVNPGLAQYRNNSKPTAEDRFTTDSQWPVVHSSQNVVGALRESSQELGLTCHEGGNFTKESLYLESDEERVKDLRREHGALSTEMEHFGLAHLTNELTRAGIPAFNGLISTVVGTVPGGSFAEPGSKEEEKANESQGKMLEAAMRALWKIAYGK
ncbi:MAG: hypothetical protein V1861_02620 [Candidatus Micrarchaeota archaeon]